MRGKRIDLSQPGRYFYPLGARDGATGIALSVCAPFEMNANRSDLIAPEASPWNRWLLDQAIVMAQELLWSDWRTRFGADAYVALFRSDTSPGLPLAHALHNHLRNARCWPTRARQVDHPGQPEYMEASKLVLPEIPALDNILASHRYLDDQLERSAALLDVLRACGAPRFTINSLVRLRCAGKDNHGLETKIAKGEAIVFQEKKWTRQPEPGRAPDPNVYPSVA
jgi:hypothetical protein